MAIASDVHGILSAIERPPRDILLVSPPAYLPKAPHLGLATLKAHASAAGADVQVADLNLASYLHFMDTTTLAAAAENADTGLGSLLGPVVLEHITDALATMRDPKRAFDLEGLQRAHHVVDRALELAMTPFDGARLSLLGCGFKLPSEQIGDVLSVVACRRRNPYLELMERWAHRASARGPTVVGVSLSYSSQLIPGLTAVAALRRVWPESFFLLGGNIIDVLGERLEPLMEAFRDIQGAVRFAGEIPLEALWGALRGHADISMVPALTWRDGTTIRTNAVGTQPRPSVLAAPHFDRNLFRQYLTPHMVLPVALGRGCYYRGCTYCDSVFEFAGTHRSRPVERLADELAAYSADLGVRHFTVVDEAVPLRRLHGLARAIVDRGLDIDYRVHARFERPGIGTGAWEIIRASGCRRIQFGLETGSDRLLEVMGKGTDADCAGTTLRDVAKAGIQTHVFIIAGYPTETDDDHRRTMKFLDSHAAFIDSASANGFVMPYRVRTDARWDAMGIRVEAPPADDLRWWCAWSGGGAAERGDRLGELQAWIRTNLSPLARKGHDLSLLFLSRFGTPAVLRTLFPPERPPCTRKPGENCVIAQAPGLVSCRVAAPPTELTWESHAVAQFMGYFAREDEPESGNEVLAILNPERDRIQHLPTAFGSLLGAVVRPVGMGRLLDLVALTTDADQAERMRLRAALTQALHDLAERDLIRVVGCTKPRRFLSDELKRRALAGEFT